MTPKQKAVCIMTCMVFAVYFMALWFLTRWVPGLIIASDFFTAAVVILIAA